MKKAIAFAIVIFMGLIFVGCGSEEKENEGSNQTPVPSQSEVGLNKYKVEKSGNSILVITNDGAAISTTEYKFSNNTLTEAILTQKYASKELAKVSYETLKKEPMITEQYSDINQNGNTITLIFKSDILKAYTGMNIDAVYDLMVQTYEPYMEK